MDCIKNRKPTIVWGVFFILTVMWSVGCSPKQQESVATPAAAVQPRIVMRLPDGSILNAQSRTNDILEGVLITKKTPEGSELKTHAAKGRIQESNNGKTVRLVLTDVDSTMEGRDPVHAVELTLTLSKH
jgi:hypothetical protein